MAEQDSHALSGLMDGELDAEHAQATMDALCRDDALAAEWRRLHQLRGLMGGGVDASFDVSAAVRDAVASEPVYLLPGLAAAKPLRSWPRYAMGGALAASIALATVVGLRQWQAPVTAPQLAVVPDAPTKVVAVHTQAQAERPPSQLNRLESYWTVHTDSALLSGQESFPPLIQDVSVDSRQ